MDAAAAAAAPGASGVCGNWPPEGMMGICGGSVLSPASDAVRLRGTLGNSGFADVGSCNPAAPETAGAADEDSSGLTTGSFLMCTGGSSDSTMSSFR